MVNPLDTTAKPTNPGNPQTFGGIQITPEIVSAQGSVDDPSLINLEETDAPAPQDQINLNTDPTASLGLSPEVAGVRAQKIHIGLGEKSPGLPVLINALETGDEDNLRLSATGDVMAEKQKTKLSLVNELARNGADSKVLLGVAASSIASDPNTIFEEQFGHAAATAAMSKGNTEGSVVRQALQEAPEAALDASNTFAGIMGKREGFERIQRDLEAKLKDQSWGSYLTDLGGTMVPLLSAYRMRNLVKEAPSGSILPGNNKEEQMDYLWGLPASEAFVKAKAAVDELAQVNLQQAQEFAHLLTNYSSSTKLLDNAFGILDATVVGDVASLVGKGIKGLKSVAGTRKFLKDVTEAASEATPDPINVIAATGDTSTAAALKVTKDILKGPTEKDVYGNMIDLRNELPALYKPDIITGRAGTLSREEADRIKSHLVTNSDSLTKALVNPGSVTRLTEEATQAAVLQTQKDLKELYPHLNDSILDFGFVRPEDDLANVGSVQMRVGKQGPELQGPIAPVPSTGPTATVMSLGRTDATLFKSPAEAVYWANREYKLPDGSYRLGQQGDKYYINIYKHVDETSDPARAAILQTNNTAPTGLFNSFFGALRSSNDLLPKLQMDNRHISSHAQSVIHEVMGALAKDIKDLKSTPSLKDPFGKRSIRDLERVLTHNREYTDATTGRRGMFYENLEDFSSGWRDVTGRPPTAKEAQAYFSYVQMSDFDWMVRNLSIHRDKARQGITSIKVGYKTADKETEGQIFRGARVTSTAFDGKILKDLPWGTDWEKTANANIFFSDGKGSGTVLSKHSMTHEQRQEITDAVQSGQFKLVQVANPIDKPFSGDSAVHNLTGTDDVVHFIVTKDIESTPLKWKQINYRPGGHVEYTQEHWVKQPNIKRIYRDGESEANGNTPLRHIYEGDRTALNFSSEAEAKDYAARMDQARIYLKDGKMAELDDYLSKNLPFRSDEFRKFFEPDKDGKIIYNKNDPFEYTRSGANTVDINKSIPAKYSNFEDSVRSPYNLYQNINKEYAGQRDEQAWTVLKGGSEESPSHKLIPARNLDPLSTMNRAMSSIMRGRFMDDYKTSAVDQFIAQFGHLLKDVSPEQLRSNPLFYLNNPVWNERLGDPQLLATAKNSQRAVVNFLGQETPFQRKMTGVKDTMMDFMYEKFNTRLYNAATEYQIDQLTNPLDFLKQTAFHTKLGLFNPMQLVLQAQTMIHTLGVAGPKNGLPGIAAGTLMMRLGKNQSPEVVDTMAGIAAKFGYNKAHFKEALEELRKTGFGNIEGEHAWKADALEPKLFTSPAGTFLNKGTWFFNQGEKLTRMTAWTTAYREWRALNPEAIMSNAERNSVLNRANILTNNMTKASNAAWQSGLLSVPTQFLAYNARMMEALMPFASSRLTTVEKTRAIATYMTMYGIPSTIGGVTGFWPAGEDIRTAAMERGINLDATATELAFNGAIGTAINHLAGRDWNFSDRMGPNGSSFIRDLLGDKNFVEVALGPSGSIAGDWLKMVDPVWRRTLAAFGSEENKDFKLMPSDFVDLGRNISSVNSTVRTIFAINTGKFFSKNDVYQTDATAAEAVWAAFTGLSLREQTDSNLIIKSLMHTKEAKQEAQNQISINVKRALQADEKGDTAGYESYMRRARIYYIAGGFRPDETAAVWKAAIGSPTSQADKAKYDFLKNAPLKQYNSRFDNYINSKEVK